MNFRDSLRRMSSPYVHLLPCKVQQAAGILSTIKNEMDRFAVVLWEGAKCATKADLFDHVSGATGFPSYFGKNWEAFSECMLDLSWMRSAGYIIVISDADIMLRVNKDLETFVEVLDFIGQEWTLPSEQGNPPPNAPFHFVLLVGPDLGNSRFAKTCSSQKIPYDVLDL